ncbi:MAG: GGDEF domain-containing protein [Candidatus Omnitrophota bacterium]
MLSREIIYLSLSYSLTLILLYIGLSIIFSKKSETELKYKYYVDKLTDYQNQVRLRVKEQAQLENKFNGIVLLYETTREISKTLEEEKVLNFLEIKLRQFIDFDECRLIEKEEKDKLTGEIYYHLPLVIEGRVVSYLAIKNLNIKDLAIDNLFIIANQVALVLKRIKLYHRLQELAITDDLTHTFSRRYLMERFKEEYSRSVKYKHKLSFLMLDIDHFKECNDKFGHLVGDIVLANVADEIRKNIRQVDLVGRFGGEEFAIILPEADKAGAQYSAERIRVAAGNRTIKAYDETVRVSVSIGVATFPDDASKPQELIDRVDWSLYRAKQTGRNRVCVYGAYT